MEVSRSLKGERGYVLVESACNSNVPNRGGPRGSPCKYGHARLAPQARILKGVVRQRYGDFIHSIAR